METNVFKRSNVPIMCYDYHYSSPWILLPILVEYETIVSNEGQVDA